MLDFSRIKKLRKKRKISLKEMGKITGLSMPTLIDLEANRQNVTLRTFEAIAKAFKMDLIIFFLYCETDSKKLTVNINVLDIFELGEYL